MAEMSFPCVLMRQDVKKHRNAELLRRAVLHYIVADHKAFLCLPAEPPEDLTIVGGVRLTIGGILNR